MKTSSWTVRRRLLLLVAALAVPMNLLVIAALFQLADRERDAQLRTLQYASRAVVSAMDAQLMAHIVIGRALAASPALLADDLAAFRIEAERALPNRETEWLVVSEPSGQQVLNLLRPSSEPLPVRASLASHRKALSTGAMVISDVFRGPVARTWLVSIDFPILRDGAPFRVMSVVIDTIVFRDLLARQGQPANWLTGVIDTQGNFIARIPGYDATVGQPAAAGWLAVMDRNSIERFPARDGEMVVNANEISDLSSWRVGIAVKEAELTQPVWTALGLAVIASIVVSLASLLLAFRLARGIAAPVVELERKAASLVAGHPEVLEPRLPEAARVWQALEAAMAKRAAAERQGRLLTDELAHRVKNTLAVVQALALHTLRSNTDPRTFAETFSSRLGSLARAHDLLTGHGWTGASLDEIATTALEPFRRPDGGIPFAILGPPVQLTANGAITVSLMLHELATNATKYGALSRAQGSVSLKWTTSNGTGHTTVNMVWQEIGGPPATTPSRRGFGTRLLMTGAAQLNGVIELKWPVEGLVCHLAFPVPCAPSKV